MGHRPSLLQPRVHGHRNRPAAGRHSRSRPAPRTEGGGAYTDRLTQVLGFSPQVPSALLHRLDRRDPDPRGAPNAGRRGTPDVAARGARRRRLVAHATRPVYRRSRCPGPRVGGSRVSWFVCPPPRATMPTGMTANGGPAAIPRGAEAAAPALTASRAGLSALGRAGAALPDGRETHGRVVPCPQSPHEKMASAVSCAAPALAARASASSACCA